MNPNDSRHRLPDGRVARRTIGRVFLPVCLLFSTAATAEPQGEWSTVLGPYLEAEASADHYQCGVVIVVDEAGVVFERGYGDCGPGHAPPDPATSVFRAASTSKLFAAVAALQLVERGELGLDEEVRSYLPDVPIDNPFPTALTTAHLLTHTGGIEPRMLGAIALTEARRRPLFEFFRDRGLRLTREPGRDISYSNLGIALAGLVVERVAKLSYDDYVEQKIFAPLGMAASSFHQPLPEALDARLVKDGRPSVYILPYPAGSMAGTARDMGAFLPALLQRGGAILSPQSVDRLLAPHWRAHPDAPGVAYGFFETFHKGLRALHHTGDGGGHHSVALLVPERKLGLYFVAATSDEQARPLRQGLARAFLDALAPPGSDPIPEAAPSGIDRSAYHGLWIGADRVESSIEKIASLPFQGHITTDREGALHITSFGGEISEKLHPIAKDLFRGTDEGYYAFRRDAAGNPDTLVVSGELSDPVTLRRGGAFEDARLHVGLVLFFALVVFSSVVVGIVRWFRKPEARPAPARMAERALALGAAIVVCCPVVIIVGFLVNHPPYDRLPAQVVLCIVLLHALAVVIVAQAYFAARAWREGWWGRAYRTYYSVACGAGLAFVGFLLYWNALGFRF